jgi:hypothetical protein
MKEIHLFVQEGCRPCLYAETQLKKHEGWDNVVTITNAKENGDWSDFAKECGVKATPTLVALIDGNIIAKVEGSNNMTSTFWEAAIKNHGG